MPGGWKRLRDRIEALCLKKGEFVLTTGQRSSFYFDCKGATLDGECLALISEQFFDRMRGLDAAADAVGGLTMGADFIVAGIIQHAFSHGTALRGSIARKEPKKHGTKSRIENELPAGTRMVVVDDVFTTGQSTMKACDEFLRAGYEIVGIIGLVDREHGGIEALAEKYRCSVQAVFTKSDFPALDSPPRPSAATA